MIELNEFADQNITRPMESLLEAKKVYKLLPTKNASGKPRTKPGTRAALRSTDLYNAS
jgi:hypothetical protein